MCRNSGGHSLFTSHQVLNISSLGGIKLTNHRMRIAFVDEFRMMLSIRNDGTFTEFILFDTLLPQDHPRNLRRAHPPLIYRDWLSLVIGLRNTSWGAFDRHGPLIVDPTQAIHVVDFFRRGSGDHATLAFRTQTLIEQVCSPSTGTDIPWSEWGRDSVALEFPVFDDSDIPNTLVQGHHLITVEKCVVPSNDQRQLRLRIFDFSLRACETLSDIGEGGESVRVVRYEDGRDLFLEGSEDLKEYELDSLDNGIFFHLVSDFCC